MVSWIVLHCFADPLCKITGDNMQWYTEPRLGILCHELLTVARIDPVPEEIFHSPCHSGCLPRPARLVSMQNGNIQHKIDTYLSLIRDITRYMMWYDMTIYYTAQVIPVQYCFVGASISVWSLHGASPKYPSIGVFVILSNQDGQKVQPAWP